MIKTETTKDMVVEESSRSQTFLTDTVAEAIARQQLHELDNAFTYQAFAGWARAKGYPGAEKWFKHQSEEEFKHANSIHEFLTKAGVHYAIPQIPLSEITLDSHTELFSQAVVIETKTTDKLNMLMSVCATEKQFLAQEFINNLLYNQLDEEYEARTRHNICVKAENAIIADMYINAL